MRFLVFYGAYLSAIKTLTEQATHHTPHHHTPHTTSPHTTRHITTHHTPHHQELTCKYKKPPKPHYVLQEPKMTYTDRNMSVMGDNLSIAIIFMFTCNNVIQ
jgi:hypothetical protein